MKIIISLLKRFIYFFLITSIVVIAWNLYKFNNFPLLEGNKVPVIINIDNSTSASKFVQLLKDKNLIRSTLILKLIIRMQGLSQNLKAGIYQIKPEDTAIQLLHRVVAGEVLKLHFVIIEGTTLQKISADLSKANYLKYTPEDWTIIAKEHPNAEGLLLADTYHYNANSSAKALLLYAHKNLVKYLDAAWTTREENLPYKNPYELLIAASIIEKETAILQEKKLISGVIVNRLRKNMPLQMDPTVIYGLGSNFTGKLSHADVHTPSVYNSYTNKGLPPTPIAMVGKESIDAAAHPYWSNYLYFVAKGDGSHQFSENYEQQKQAISQYKDF